MAVSDILQHLPDVAKQAVAFFHEAVHETKMYLALGKDKALGALAGLAGVAFGGDHAAGEHVAANNVGSPIRGGPGTGRA